MPREGTSSVAGMSRNAKRSGSQFNLSAPVKVNYFFAAPYYQRFWFSRKNVAARLINLRAKQIPFACHRWLLRRYI